ncbi:MAG: exodeoxyribonuclease VII small subunit [Bacillota bacterium]|nr:exodeoxyribonuclease VII small subunit [Bacillota bacterium]
MKEINLENNLKELEKIFEKLENENVPLSESLKLFEMGINIYRESIDEIEKTKTQITVLVENKEKKIDAGDLNE